MLPEHRRKGIGEKPLFECIKKMKKLNVDVLMTRVLAENMPAISLYQKLGFKIRNYGVTLEIHKD